MKLKPILMCAGLLLASGACAFAALSTNSAKGALEVAAYSADGLTKVTAANSASLIGSTAYVIGSNTGYGLTNSGSGKLAKTGDILALTICEGTSGSSIVLKRNDNQKYLNDPIGGSWSDSPVTRYLNSVNDGLSPNSNTDKYYWAVKFPGDSTVYYETHSEGSMGNQQSIFYVYALADDGTEDATTFAQTFLDTTDGICKDTSKVAGDTSVSELAAVWNAKQTPDGTSLVEKWNALSGDAKEVFTTGTANETIADANARYVHIMSRYSGSLTSFTDGPSYALSPVTIQSNSTMNIVVAISVVGALSAVLGGAVLLRRKQTR